MQCRVLSVLIVSEPVGNGGLPAARPCRPKVKSAQCCLLLLWFLLCVPLLQVCHYWNYCKVWH